MRPLVFCLSPGGTSGERIEERGNPMETALLSPALSSLRREEREKSKRALHFHSIIQQQCW